MSTSTKLDFKFRVNDLNANKTQLLAGFELLKHEQTITEKFYDSSSNSSILEFFFYINNFTQANFSGKNAPQICEFFLENNFHHELARLGEFFSQKASEIKRDPSNDTKAYGIKNLFLLSLYITNFLTAYSRRFCIKFFELGAAKHMISMLSNETFVNEFASERAFQFILLNISVLASEADNYKNEWNEMNAVQTLLKIAERNKTFQRTSYGTVLRIANDKQIQEIADIPEIVTMFIRSITRAADEIAKAGDNVAREKMEYGDEDGGDKESTKAFDVYSVEDEFDVNIRYPITGVLNTVYKLSVNDKIKYDLYVKYNVKEPLRVIIFKGSEIEKRYAVKLLAQLCFDTLVLDMVSRDLELVKQIEHLSTLENVNIAALPKTCKQILWNLNAKSTAVSAVEEKSQIMISYNSASRDMCLKIKSELEKAGYKIWIDIDEIHGSSLDSMATAVEQSHIILICVSENYRQSINCQAEAQYAFKLKKPIVPIIMQKGYESVGGWLGMIMGDRIHINFTKHVFTEAIDRLKTQITRLTPTESLLTKNMPPTSTQIQSAPALSQAKTESAKSSTVSQWTEDEVEKWFQANGNMTLYEHLKPCNGELLLQLYEMKNSAPEFYYQFIAVENKIDRRTLLVFTNNLKKLFD